MKTKLLTLEELKDWQKSSRYIIDEIELGTSCEEYFGFEVYRIFQDDVSFGPFWGVEFICQIEGRHDYRTKYDYENSKRVKNDNGESLYEIFEVNWREKIVTVWERKME